MSLPETSEKKGSDRSAYYVGEICVEAKVCLKWINPEAEESANGNAPEPEERSKGPGRRWFRLQTKASDG